MYSGRGFRKDRFLCRTESTKSCCRVVEMNDTSDRDQGVARIVFPNRRVVVKFIRFVNNSIYESGEKEILILLKRRYVGAQFLNLLVNMRHS